MLDIETKRRIDTARDILVGKVPDPKSQVEQITIALIYKFMDDMDAEAEELGGKRKFFTGDYARYGWAKLMRSGLGGHELLGLYAEGISKMPENPGIPLLFRDIFKNAFLPYRDPETLKAFLKVIDEFTYDHSERLGDAFEYLLSVLGSQGDAGQFRTPRHIIDFIVSIINPTKKDTVLDPACGTAGFLISSYKHILKANTDSNGQLKLTPDEKGQLAKNFKGYDISPDMVRLSLVNLYLHGFTDPHIYEYDTLTSEERWNEYADVILANPPFMSPKGGIKPHKRFSIQAKRSEVLFVDYMAEHLTPKGRAGIIVPEGIIFQSQGAYTELRKMLIENSLIAVLSLPAGVFNPYSGVKTSILILDKSLARQSNHIAFFKIENDGFGLGAQRREIERNDLPQARAEICEYLRRLRAHEPLEDFQPTIGLVVPKDKIADNGDYNLSGERYRENGKSVTEFPFHSIGDIATEIKAGFASGQSSVDTKGVPHIRPMNITDKGQFTWEGVKSIAESEFEGKEDYSLQVDDVLFNNTNSKELVGKTCLVKESIRGGYSNHLTRVRVKPDLCVPNFLALLLHNAWRKGEFLKLANKWIGQAGVNAKSLSEFQIPLPPLGVQKEIVAEIECYQKVIDGARAVVDNYRPHIPIHPDWPVHELSEIIEGKPKNGYSGRPVDRPTSTKVLSLSATTSGKLDLTKFKFLDEDIPPEAECRCRKGDIYLQRGNTAELVGTAALFDVDEPSFVYPDLMIRVQANESKVNRHYLLHALQSQPIREFLRRNAVGAAGSMPKINQSIVERIPIPLPSLETQNDFIAEVESEQALVNANRELIVRMEKKVQATLARIWGQADQPVAES